MWREKCSVLVKRQVAPGPEGMERAYELLQPYYLQVNSYQDTFFVKAIICLYYHFKSEHFYHISFKLLPNALNYWNLWSTRKPGQGWLLSSLQRSRPSNFYQQSDNSSYWLLISMWQSFFCGSSVHCSVQVPECRKHNVFSVTPSRCRPPLHTGKKITQIVRHSGKSSHHHVHGPMDVTKPYLGCSLGTSRVAGASDGFCEQVKSLS